MSLQTLCLSGFVRTFSVNGYKLATFFELATVPIMENKRDTGLYFKLSAKEMELIHQKKALTRIRNTSAYLCKMVIDGYVINLDIKQLNEISRLLRITSNNVNQMAKRANETGSIYKTDVADVKKQLDSIKTDYL